MDDEFLSVAYRGIYKNEGKEIRGLLFLYQEDIEEFARKKLIKEHDFDEVEILGIHFPKEVEE